MGLKGCKPEAWNASKGHTIEGSPHPSVLQTASFDYSYNTLSFCATKYYRRASNLICRKPLENGNFFVSSYTCVKSLTGCAGSYSYPLWIVASETNGILQMVLTQAFEDTTLAKAIFQELESQVPGTRYKEWGHHVFGDYTLKSVKRLPVKYQS